MRKSNAEAAETRKRILETASGLFLSNGITATAISDVMSACGLTQGGFYRHFTSKEHLVADASAVAFDYLQGRLDELTSGKPPREALQQIVHAYLRQHQAGDGRLLCPLANLSTELGHADQQVKEVITAGYSRLVKLIAAPLMRLDYQDYIGLAESIVSILVGAVSLLRMADDEALADSITANAENTVQLLLQGAPTQADLVLPRH
ncbi:TetR/AcrR family transcriptional regulator [Herbaspirillum huttiense]|uniref:TetR/AcrR family transcriptional regulator n=1 Tax=Herbaspirillum huttiense TaxID=863372 RepID=UPI0039AEE505